MIASGSGAIGDEVVAFQVSDSYSSALNTSAENVFPKPPRLTFPQAAIPSEPRWPRRRTLVGVAEGETVLVHGASGGVGSSVVQQAVDLGANVIGTASERDFDAVRGFGATPVQYGPGLEQPVRRSAPSEVDAAIHSVGVDEAIDVSLILVSDRHRIVSTAALRRVRQDGFQIVGAANPHSGQFQAAARKAILDLAAQGKLTVPIGQTFPMSETPHSRHRSHGHSRSRDAAATARSSLVCAGLRCDGRHRSFRCGAEII